MSLISLNFVLYIIDCITVALPRVPIPIPIGDSCLQDKIDACELFIYIHKIWHLTCSDG